MDNLCDACSTDQHCCTRLSDLLLTRDEYEAQFKQHENNLFVKQSDGVYIVTPRNGTACPYWGRGACTIYRNRPIDCRLYPYMMTRVDKENDELKINVNTSSRCPKSEALRMLMPEAEARALIAEFWRNVVGDEIPIIIQRESGFVSHLRSWFKAIVR